MIPATSDMAPVGNAMPYECDVALLLPKITDWERTKVRYGGLASQLVENGLSIEFVESHDRYMGGGVFVQSLQPLQPELGAIAGFTERAAIRPKVVRDLTMPNEQMPLYADLKGPVLVHDPSINNLLRSKSETYQLFPHLQPKSIPFVESHDVEEAIAAIRGSQVVVKPDTGSGGNGVLIGTKTDVLREYNARPNNGLVIVQEAIDMSRGITVAGNETLGVHNARFIVIGQKAIFGFVRNDETGSLTMQGETFKDRTFLLPEDFDDELTAVLQQGIDAFGTQEYSDDTVVAFDLIHGTSHDGEVKDYILEVNSRPLRNSPYDGRDANTLWASSAWDFAEAATLARVVSRIQQH